MPHDPRLAGRIRRIMAGRRGVGERRMFGGVCFTVNGHMCCGVSGDDLVVRLGGAGAAAALAEPHTRPMDFTGRALRTMVYVAPGGLRGDALRRWVGRALRFAMSLPPR